MRKNKDHTAAKSGDVDILQTVPVVRVESEIAEDGKVTLLVPRYHSRLAKKLLGAVSGKDVVRVDLDEIGSKVWRLIDGHRSVAEITHSLQSEMDVEQAEARMQLFIRALSARRFVDLFIVTQQEEAPPQSQTGKLQPNLLTGRFQEGGSDPACAPRVSENSTAGISGIKQESGLWAYFTRFFK